MEKYLILDFGRVLGFPPTGSWFVTPKLLEVVGIENINPEIITESIRKNSYLMSTDLDIFTLEEEYEAFVNYYEKVLQDANILNFNLQMAKTISYSKVYEYDQCKLYEDVYIELERLSKKYKLLLLTDNWPSIKRYMEHYDILKFFTKIYISSMYKTNKSKKDFFDLPIKEFNIKNNAIFVDDKEKLLDIAKEKGLDVLLMDRKCKNIESKYKVIHSLNEIK